MTQQFHEGQEVEVQYDDGEWGSPRDTIWRKATILECEVDYYLVQFPDGTRYTFDYAHIRGIAMTQQFHEGQEVEVWGANMYPWRKAKIVAAEIHRGALRVPTGAYIVEYRDGSRAVVDAEHIRAADPRDEVFPRAPKTSEADHRTMLAGDSAEEYPGLAEPDDDTSEPMGRIP